MAHAGDKRARDNGISKGVWSYPEDFLDYLWDVYSSAGTKLVDPELLALRLCESREDAAEFELADASTAFLPVFLAAAAGDKSTMEVFQEQGYALFPGHGRMPRKYARFCCSRANVVADTIVIMFNCGIDLNIFRWALTLAFRSRSRKANYLDRAFWWQMCMRPNCEHWKELIRLGFIGEEWMIDPTCPSGSKLVKALQIEPQSSSGYELVKRFHNGLSSRYRREREAWEKFVRLQVDLSISSPCLQKDDFLSVMKKKKRGKEQYWFTLTSNGLFREIAMRNPGDYCFRAAMTRSTPFSDGQRKILLDVARTKGWLWDRKRYDGVDDLSLSRLAELDPDLCRRSTESLPDFDRKLLCEDVVERVQRKANFRARCRLLGWRKRMRVGKMGLRS